MGANNKAIVQATPADLGGMQPHFNSSMFDQTITDKGYICSIERALACPCKDPKTGIAFVSCQNCGGKGWFFIDKQSSIVLATSMSNRTKYETWNETNAGTISISMRPEDRPGFMDRVILTELQYLFSEKLPIYTNVANTALFSYLTYSPISVYQVYLFNGPTNPLVWVPQGTGGYTINDNKILLDYNTYKNYVNPIISIRYTCNPAYHIIDINRDLIKQTTGRTCDATANIRENLPLHCIGRKAQFIFEAANYSGNSLFDNTNYLNPAINYDR